MAWRRRPGPVCGSIDDFDDGTLACHMSAVPGPICSERDEYIHQHIHSHSARRRHSTKPNGRKRSKHAKPVQHKVQTDPKVWAALNSEFGTRVDFSKVSEFEGNQMLTGYVPTDQQGHVLGRSGLTIATGFDVGQFTLNQLQELGIPSDLLEIVKPYAGLTRIHALHALREAEKRDGHGPIITKAQADLIDKVVKGYHLRAAKIAWNRKLPAGGQKFEELTVAQQTVIFSRTFHQGPGMPDTTVAKKFYTAAQAGDWELAEKELRNYDVKPDWYKHRVHKEADLLAKERKTESAKKPLP